MGKASLALALCFSTSSSASPSYNGQTSVLGDLFLWSVSVVLAVAWEFCLESLLSKWLISVWEFESKVNRMCVSAHESLHPGTTYTPATQARLITAMIATRFAACGPEEMQTMQPISTQAWWLSARSTDWRLLGTFN